MKFPPVGTCWRTYGTLLCRAWLAISLQELLPQPASL